MLLVDESTDLAVIGPVEGDVTDISAEPQPIRNPTHNDRNHCVWVHVARELAPVGAFVHEVDIPARVFRADGSGEIVMYDLVAIDPVTKPGDSGAPVLDENETLIGFVVGADAVRTYVLPAEKGLNALETCGG
jgi:hypothetical protein